MSDDNLEPLITQCPNCETRFRVTEAQLQVAAGRVRCGACLTVFEGTAHLILDGEAIAPEADSEDVDAVLEELEEVGEHGKATTMPDIDADDLAVVGEADIGADEAEVPDELAQLEAQFLAELKGDAGRTRTDGDSLEADAAVIPEPLGVNVSEAVPAGDEAGEAGTEEAVTELEATLGDDDTDKRAAESLDEDLVDAVADELEDAFAEKAVGGDESSNADDTRDGLADSDEDTRVDADTAADIDDAMANDPSAWLESVTDDVWSEDEQGANPEVAAAAEDAVQTADRAEQIDEIELTAQADPELPAVDYAADLEMTEPERRRSWMTLAVSLLLLIGLPLQVLWFQYDAWVKDPELRPIYASLCAVTGCELPPMRDVSLISSKRSFIRAHPERADARIVDVLMVNNADFAQPYPLIELTATSLRGQLIAGRRFKPDEYLQGEVAEAELMPPRTPVHVSLEIQDPGAEAMNFEVKFR